MEQKSNSIIAKNINEIAKSIFDHFLLVNTLSSQQLADMSSYLELLHQLLSAYPLFIFDVRCNYYYRVFVII